MIAVHSFFKNTTDIKSNITYISKQAELSCKFLKKHKFTVILYTDEISINYFRHIKYDNIVTLDISEIQPNIPFDFWSASKLIVCSTIKEPYFHVDTDLFLVENCLDNYLDKDFFVFHEESWIKQKSYTENKDLIYNHFNHINDNSFVYNNAIFGGKNHMLINSSINFLINSIIQKNEIIDQILFDKKPRRENDGAKSVFIEQYLFNNLVKQNLKIDHIPLILKESSECKNSRDIYALLKKYHIIHLWIQKYSIDHVIGLSNFIDMLDKKYF
jgi:hypothetical protein